MNKIKLHPLINPNSMHYENNAGQPNAISLLEDKLTVPEMRGFAKGNIFKYELRKDKKGQLESDLIKIYTYKMYLLVLDSLGDTTNTVSDVFTRNNIQFRYSILDQDLDEFEKNVVKYYKDKKWYSIKTTIFRLTGFIQ